jgi:hypothetical protein
MTFDIQKVLAKSDLLEYVRRAGGELNGGGNRYASHCVLHGGDNDTALSIYFQDDRWHWKCWTGNCGQGDAISFVEKWQNFTETTRDGRKISAFQQACEWINGGKIEDAEGMQESAATRLESARLERIAAQQREEARRKEFQTAGRHVYYHKMRTQYHKDAWLKAGIDDGMQDFWMLGGSEDFTYKMGEHLYHTPTLTIPIFSTERELLTIQHRLLNPKNPKDKYRPDITGLRSHPFLAVPEMGYDGGLIWVMEGAKKAMVTWTRADSDWQCIGVMSQGEYKNLVEALLPVGQRVIVVPDPDSARNPNSFLLGHTFAKAIGGKCLRVPEKIDDLILATKMTANDLYAMSKQARKA